MDKKGEIPLTDSIDKLLKKYDFHPRVKTVSLKLFNDDHYKEAIQASFVEVINKVKEIAGHPKDNSGKALDGDQLMQKTFGCDGSNIPLIKLNKLDNSLDKAEQRGLMLLFKGIVGIRHKKAHLNFIQNDPNKTIEYLALSSLLMRLLEDDFLREFNTLEHQHKTIQSDDNMDIAASILISYIEENSEAKLKSYQLFHSSKKILINHIGTVPVDIKKKVENIAKSRGYFVELFRVREK